MWSAAVLLLCCGSAFGYHWTLPASQELFRTLLTNASTCQYMLEEEPFQMPGFGAQTPNTATPRVMTRYSGICAPDVESCIHLGTTPRQVLDEFRGPTCQVCCARKPCGTFPSRNGQFRNGYCMLPELLEFSGTDGSTESNQTDTFGTSTSGQFVDGGLDRWDEMCLAVGGNVAQVTPNVNYSVWWDIQCPMSGRCCLYPEADQCTSCGQKYGRMWNFTQYVMPRSGGQEEALAWKTAVHQMAGTGWNMGMQPVMTPGFSEQYSNTPPNYDSLLSPQAWNNGLNYLAKGSTKKGDDGDDDDDNDEDDYKGWCWQGAILSKSNGNLRCSGALISEKYFLTTAACVNFTTGGFGDYKIRFGGTDLRKATEKYATEYEIAGVFLHPSYDPTEFDNNIAIVELQKPVVCNGKDVCTICLPSPFIMNFGNFSMGRDHPQYIRDDVRQCVATGWGRRVVGGTVSYLKEMPYVPVYNNDTFCETNIRTMKGVLPEYTLPNNSFCAAPQVTSRGKFVSACQGDAGGPLACWYGGRFYLTGLISTFNNQRCETGKMANIVGKILQPNKHSEIQPLMFDVFTDVAQFLPWINRIIYGFF